MVIAMPFCGSLFMTSGYDFRMRSWPILAVIAILVALTWLLWELSRVREPEYQGKSLTAWVQQYDRLMPGARAMSVAGRVSATGSPADREKWVEASRALEAIGTNALPFAFHLAANHDSVVKRLLIKIPLPLNVLDKLGCKEAYMHWTVASTECPQLGDRIFMLVGRKATFPLPPILRLLRGENPNSRIVAAHLLWYHVQWQVEELVQPALPALAEALADSCAPVRRAAYSSLKGISQGNAPPLKSAERQEAYRAESARLLLPVLIRLLHEPNADRLLVLKAIGDLERFGNSATTHVWSFKDDADPTVSQAAWYALTRIAAKD
jgi:hypothetical protein